MEEEKKNWFRRHLVLTIILGIILLIIIYNAIVGSGGNSSSQTGKAINSQNTGNTPTNNNLASLNAKVNPMGNNLYTYSITNRNDYTWHNLTITIDSYYECTSGGSLGPGQETMISGPTCGNWIANHMEANPVIQLMNIQTSEGSEPFTLQTIP